MPEPVLRLGVVGLHNQGRDYLEVLATARAFAGEPVQGVRLTAVCDNDAAELEAVERDEFALGPEVTRHADVEKAFADPEVDAWIVAVPHHLHRRMVDLAVLYRKALLKEKPLGRTLTEAQRLVSNMRGAGLVLHTGVQRRHHASYRALAEALVGQRVVSARLVMTVRARPAQSSPPAEAPMDWRQSYDQAGGGVLVDLGYHGAASDPRHSGAARARPAASRGQSWPSSK
jgi:predicted dehydrogenase